MSVAAFLISVATSGQAQEQKFKAVSVKTPDGLTISAQDWGNPNGPEILFIHGFSQSHLSWIKQVTSSDLAKEFHMVTYDLRGHGLPSSRSGTASQQCFRFVNMQRPAA
jgi:pimeloyl-ACP methyl ester carboxylesterase